MSQKLQEAEQNVRDAEKALTTGFFKRKPDYDEAALYYENAAKAFQYLKQYPQAIDCFLKSADCKYKNGDTYFSARCFENIGMIQQRDLKNQEEAAKYFKAAADRFRQNNNLERAIEMLEKAGKSLEQTQPERAVQFYVDACDIYVEEDRKRLAVETFKKVVGLYLKINQMEKAIEFSQRLADLLIEIDGKHLTNRACLSVIILVLFFGDEVEAGKKFELFTGSSRGFVSSDEGVIARELLDGYEKRDQPSVAALMKKPLIGYLDNEITKVARKLIVPGGIVANVADAQPMLPPEHTTSLVDDLPEGNDIKTNEETTDLC